MLHSRTWNTVVVTTLLVVVFLVSSGCGKPKMVLDHECVGPWAQINNHFARANPNDPLWNGVLVQLGKYQNHPDGFGKITFYKKGLLGGQQQVGNTLNRGDFKWLNIVPEGTNCQDSWPMDAKYMSKLLNNRLQQNLQPKAIITYWHLQIGTEKRYQVHTETVKVNIHTTFEFVDDIRICVWGQIGAQPPNLIVQYDPRAVNRIMIEETRDTINHGSASIPPW